MNRLRQSYKFLALIPLLAPLAASPSCQPAFTTEIPGRSLSIQITQQGGIGTDADPLPISFSTPQLFVVKVQALDDNGNLDPTFQGFVRFSLQPGSVVSATGANTNGRNVKLVNGEADNVTISVVGAYGDSRIWVEDLGYEPSDPAGSMPPQCADGIDNNNNGLVDYPVDPGCYAANDNSENGGTYAGAASEIIHFIYPRIADVRGVINGGAGTPFPNEQVQVNTQWHGTTTNTPKGVVVVGLGASGFFVTDIGETRGFASLYGYTYSAPALMYVCDRLINFGGTSADFYGFTEMNYPTWSLEEWDPTVRPCLVPEPTTLDPGTINQGTSTLATLEAGLVQVPTVGCSGLTSCCNSASFAGAAGAIDCVKVTDPMAKAACVAGVVEACNNAANVAADPNANNPEATCKASLDKYATPVAVPGSMPASQLTYCSPTTVRVSANFGPTLVPHTLSNGVCTIPPGGISQGTTNCDYLGTGKIDFTDVCEAACSAACTSNLDCTEYSNFIANEQFTLVVVDAAGVKYNIFGNGSASASFDPVALSRSGANLGGFTGNLMYFSGGSQFTITARCADDVVIDASQLPLPSSQACVVSRAIPDTAAAN